MKKVLVGIFMVLLVGILIIAQKTGVNLDIFYKEPKIGLEVKTWDNIYEGHNLQFFYLNPRNENIRKYGEKHRLSEIVKDDDDSFNKALKYMSWLHERVEYSESIMDSEKDAKDIMFKGEEKIKVSNDDFTTLFNEGAAYLKIINRKGIFRGINGFARMDKSFFKIIEVWSDKYNKWIMLDVSNGYYAINNDIPLSALEVLNEDIEKLKVVSTSSSNENEAKESAKTTEIEEYKDQISKYLKSYSVALNNNKYGENYINSYVSYVSDTVVPQIETREGFIQPTIFVQKEDVFNINPKIEYVNDESDKKMTLIFAKRDLKMDKDNIKKFSGGVFKNGVQIDGYYISINGHDWFKQETEKYFFDLEIKEGENSIKLSEDGNTIIREVIIENNNKKSKK